MHVNYVCKLGSMVNYVRKIGWIFNYVRKIKLLPATLSKFEISIWIAIIGGCSLAYRIAESGYCIIGPI